MSKAQQHRPGAGQAQKGRAKRPPQRDGAKPAEEREARSAEPERESERARQDERERRSLREPDFDDEPEDRDSSEDDDRDDRRGERDTWIDERE